MTDNRLDVIASALHRRYCFNPARCEGPTAQNYDDARAVVEALDYNNQRTQEDA